MFNEKSQSKAGRLPALEQAQPAWPGAWRPLPARHHVPLTGPSASQQRQGRQEEEGASPWMRGWVSGGERVRCHSSEHGWNHSAFPVFSA